MAAGTTATSRIRWVQREQTQLLRPTCQALAGLYCVVYACKTFLRVRNGDVASRQGVLGGSWTQLGSDWLACRYGGGTGDGGAHGQQGQRHLGWRRGRGHGRDGGKVLAAMAAFVALNGRLGPWRESAAQCLILPF